MAQSDRNGKYQGMQDGDSTLKECYNQNYFYTRYFIGTLVYIRRKQNDNGKYGGAKSFSK